MSVWSIHIALGDLYRAMGSKNGYLAELETRPPAVALALSEGGESG